LKIGVRRKNGRIGMDEIFRSLAKLRKKRKALARHAPA
jgi:hypothetical protein